MAIEETVGESLRDRGEFVAAAESCTGGLIGSLLTDVPGSSDYFDRSVVTYSYDAKLALGVPREHLDSAGAVSEPVARAMARAVRDASGVTWGSRRPGSRADRRLRGEARRHRLHRRRARRRVGGRRVVGVGSNATSSTGDRDPRSKGKIAERALSDLRSAVEAA